MADPNVLSQFLSLPQGEKVIAEYIWLGGTGKDLRSKTKVLDRKPSSIADVPMWSCDGSSCFFKEAKMTYSEILLVPKAMYTCPFLGSPNLLVLAEAYQTPNNTETPTNGSDLPALQPGMCLRRAACAAVMAQVEEQDPWFGIEQEYYILDPATKWPLGWSGYFDPQNQIQLSFGLQFATGPFFCTPGTGAFAGREVAMAHLKACVAAGIRIGGVNSEGMLGQNEYQVGPCRGIEMGDELIISRYILMRIGELFNVIISFEPKPIPNTNAGTGGHTNYSTKATRTKGSGWEAIQQYAKLLESRHKEHMAAYGGADRLLGAYYAPSANEFRWGVGDRGASVRVGNLVPLQKCGYMEDRRPSGDLDPYVVTRMLVETTLLLQ
ncbi:glutamine synthetase [Coccomyxa subellipsoidea C-169]|uniref:glutamine synthetase n=1 Tax=Coccomyxa subellipsoidea (strain C-169) TaxID=574566 RepID=I0YSV3_COCSC|nr:glutamine synthetase [Coccomyxa subellipsoidea C-169]EIE21472.1 glutamine synthetase [Coccomyxa subellipsoidea C-169]|eukprot:XP_005646016.1 glutamine synthetase [Coccomyxa subellipsoidea C-169]